jgi:hypothetical protein
MSRDPTGHYDWCALTEDPAQEMLERVTDALHGAAEDYVEQELHDSDGLLATSVQVLSEDPVLAAALERWAQDRVRDRRSSGSAQSPRRTLVQSTPVTQPCSTTGTAREGGDGGGGDGE